MSGRGPVIVLFLLLGSACGSVEELPPARVVIGVHDVILAPPEGWEHLDHGLEHRFHHGLSQISLADVGPVIREGYLREVGHALELFRNHQAEDAREQLVRLDLESAFSSARRWKEIASGPWRIATNVGRGNHASRSDVEAAYVLLLREIERLESADLPTLVERALPDLDHGAQRDVAERHPVVIDGRPALRVETWDRLSHDHRRSYLFLLNEGNLLVARMELGKYAEMQPAFEALVGSLQIHSGADGPS